MRVNKSLKTTLYSNLTVKFVNSASVKVFSNKFLDTNNGRVPRWITGFYFHNPLFFQLFSQNNNKITPQVTQGELLF